MREQILIAAAVIWTTGCLGVALHYRRLALRTRGEVAEELLRLVERRLSQ